ncbi:unnamed protein product, partial [Lymnaea stagnalis]
MWKGIEGSSKEIWKERCQVFTWINELGESLEEIKRRLLEMMLHNCMTDIRSSGVQTPLALSENVIKLI